MHPAPLSTPLTRILTQTPWIGGHTSLYLNLRDDGTGSLVHLVEFSSLYAQNLAWRIVSSSTKEDPAERRAKLDAFVVKPEPASKGRGDSLADVTIAIALTTQYEVGPPTVPVAEREFKIVLRTGRWFLSGHEEAQTEDDECYALCMEFIDAAPVPPEECLVQAKKYPHIVEGWMACRKYYGWKAAP